MKLFVTGGTGFVGCHFINRALQAGHEILALRRSGSHLRLPLVREPQWIEGNLDGDFSAELKGCDVLVHLASHTPNPPYDTLARCLYWNVSASLQLAEQARLAGVVNFLVAGSCFEYGRSAERYDRIPVTAPLEPTLSYPTSKAAASVAFSGFAAEHRLNLKLLRIFQVYGEGEAASRLWPSLRAAAIAGKDFPMSAGEQIRDFISVDAVAEAFLRELDFSDTQRGLPLLRNLGSGTPSSLRSFAEHWWTHWEGKGRLLFGAVPYRQNEIMRLVPEL